MPTAFGLSFGMPTYDVAGVSAAISDAFNTTNAGGAAYAFTNSDRTFTGTTSPFKCAVSVDSKTSGKVYFEALIDSGVGVNAIDVGIVNTTLPPTQPGDAVTGWGYIGIRGRKYHSGAPTDGYATCVAGSVIGCAFDMATGRIWWAKNNVWIEGSPSANTVPSYSDVSGTVRACAAVGVDNPAGVTLRLRASQQTYAPPTGFTAWIP